MDTEKHNDLSFFRHEINIILLTYNETEYQAVITEMEPTNMMFQKSVVFPSENIVVGKFANHKTALIQAHVGSTSAYLQDAISTFPNAKLVIVVGCCIAYVKGKYNYGDVLVSKRVVDINLDFKNDVCQEVDTIKTLQSVFCSDLTFGEHYSVTTFNRKSNVDTGTFVISDPFYINNQKFQDQFQAIRDLIGFELEGRELLQFQKEGKISGFILIKGIADYADNDTTNNEEWQFSAAMAAVHYAKNKLQQHLLEERKHHALLYKFIYVC